MIHWVRTTAHTGLCKALLSFLKTQTLTLPTWYGQLRQNMFIVFINVEFRMQYFQYLKNKFICCRNSLLLILFLEFFRISWNFLKSVVSFLEKIFFSWIWIKINTGDQGVDRKHLLLMHFPLTIQKNSQPVLRCYPFGSCSYTDS